MAVGSHRHSPATLPSRKIPSTHWIGGWVGPTESLDGCGKSQPLRDSIFIPSGPQQFAEAELVSLHISGCTFLPAV